MRLTLTMITAALFLTVAACGGDNDQAEPAATTATTKETISADQRAYLDALAAIDPGLVANESRALSRAEDTCLDLDAGEITGSRLAERVATRLSGGDAQISAAQAEQVIEAAKRYICPSA